MDTLPLVVLYVAGWLGLDYAFSVWSGWRHLAERFRAMSKPGGPRIRWQVVRFGPIPETGVTNMIPAVQGLYIYAGLLYRGFRPALLIPWSEISPAREVRELWWKRYEVPVADATKIRMSRRAYRRLEPFLVTNRPPNKPLDRPGMNALRSAVPTSAGRSAPSR